MARAEFLVIPKVSLKYLNLLRRQPLAVRQCELGSFLVGFSFSSVFHFHLSGAQSIHVF
jgi:hypothetical protein